MKSIELIAAERREHFTKHGRSIDRDVAENANKQLATAAMFLIAQRQRNVPEDDKIPPGWDKMIWEKMVNKPYKERLIIAGALIAAEIDRLIALEIQTKQP